MTMVAYIIPPSMVAKAWPGVESMIDGAYESADELMPADIVDQMRDGFRQLWVVWDGDIDEVVAAVMTRVVLMRSGRVCQITAAGGDHVNQWAHLITLIEQYAKAERCSKVMIEGRAGWSKLFQNYKRVRVVLEREI